MIRPLSLPMILTSGTSLLIGLFFLLLYLRLRNRHPESVRHYFLFSLLALVSGTFLAGFSVLVNSGDNLDRLDVANRVTIVFSMFTILLAVHFFSEFFAYRPPFGLRWCYVVNALFALICLVPNRHFLAKEFYQTSTYYTGLVFGPIFQLWGAWVLAISCYSLLILFLVYRRALRNPESHNKGPVLALLMVTAIWLLGGIADDLTCIQWVDLPPLAWVGSFLIIGCIAWILILQIDRLFEDRQRLHNKLILDHLTEVHSRGFFEVQLAEAIASLRRKALTRVHLCMFDVDDFKQINDRFGHAAGDQVLRHIAATAKTAVRDGDCVARLGGDEFVILLRGLHTEEEANRIIERVRASVAGYQFQANGEAVTVSCSFGIAACVPEDARLPDVAERLLADADQSLYASKRKGKNKITGTVPAFPDDETTPGASSANQAATPTPRSYRVPEADLLKSS
jgi:diguanylate cyclase (GGDEF)-like protein